MGVRYPLWITSSLLLPISLNIYPKELNSKHEKKIAHFNNTEEKKKKKILKILIINLKVVMKRIISLKTIKNLIKIIIIKKKNTKKN